MSLKGLIAFASYIVHVWARWGRLTFRRYGLRGVFSPSYRPRRAGVGRGARHNAFGRAHDVLDGTRVWYILRQLEIERQLVAS